MLRLLCLICLACAFAKENFRVNNTGSGTNASAVAKCFETGKCDAVTGCCNGHGVCQSNGTTANCVCEQASECSPGVISFYSGSKCEISPSVCCTSSTDDLTFSVNGACHLEGQDPALGARGRLLKRDGNAWYNDSLGTQALWSKNITQMVNDLLSSGSTPTSTSGNMMGLGFLEFALKDIVDFAYSTDTVTFEGITYPKLKWQDNTGVQVGTQAIPKQFENNATAVIDVGPLYDWATPIVDTPYLDLTSAMSHWNTTHHMSHEFLVALRFYHAYHKYAARNLEEYFCGQNSLGGSFVVTDCTRINDFGGNSEAFRHWIFDQARRSTIRFSQALLEQSVLQILLEHGSNEFSGYHDTFFNLWFRRDQDPPTGAGPSGSARSTVRQHQEWNGDVTRANLTHHLISGLDFLISMRNPSTDTASATTLSQSQCGIVPSDLAYDVIALTKTPLKRYGSRINSIYKADLSLQLYRAGELGLADYTAHVGSLTDQASTSTSGLLANLNVYYGAQIEASSVRQYAGTTASVAFASVVPINDVLIVDRSSYWHADSSGFWTGVNYHPDPKFITLPAFDFQNCYQSEGDCTLVSANAAAVVLGYHPDMSILRDEFYMEENTGLYRSNGVTFSSPDLSGIIRASDPVDAPSYTYRQTNMYRLLPEFINPLFYQFDGLNSLAVKQAGSEVRYLPNQLVDIIPTNIGWTNSNYDGSCSNLLPSDCTRQTSSFWPAGAPCS